MCQENNENYRLMRLCSTLTRPEHASSTPRKSRNCCGWVSSARCHNSKKCNKQYKSLFLRECMSGGSTSWNAKPKYCNLNKATCTTFFSTIGKNTGSLVDVVICEPRVNKTVFQRMHSQWFSKMNNISDLTTFIASELVRAQWLLIINLAGLKSQYIPLNWTGLLELKRPPLFEPKVMVNSLLVGLSHDKYLIDLVFSVITVSYRTLFFLFFFLLEYLNHIVVGP